jgi:hypothetical protein
MNESGICVGQGVVWRGRARFLRVAAAPPDGRFRRFHPCDIHIVHRSEDRAAPDGAANAGRIPRATYRIQFNHGFTFRDAAEVVPYLAELGVSDLYASPYLQARRGACTATTSPTTRR